MVYNSAKTAVTVTSEYASGTLKSSNYESSVVTITAAGRTKGLNIEGNSKANKIIGTSANDTLNGTAGNDTLTGGGGADVFIFDGKGTDVVTDYEAGEDTLKITGTVSTYTISGSDATFKVGIGSVKIIGGKNKTITVVDTRNKITIYDGGLIYDGDIAKAKAVTVTAAYSSNILASYGASVVTIDSSARTKALKITGEISAYSISGSDATFKVGSGSVKVTGGKSTAITVVDSNKNISTYQNGAIYNNATPSKATAITLTSAYGNSLTAASAVISVDAAPRTNDVKIIGNAKNNFLSGGNGKDSLDGGKGADTLHGGKGADTLTGGEGRDVFVYADGDGGDVITDYVSGEDVIKLTSGTVKDYSVKNGDAMLKIGSGTITLKSVGTSAISVLDADNELRTYENGLVYNATKVSRSTVVTITSGYESSEFGSYGASVETIDASGRSKAVEIVGNSGGNYILGGTGKDTIDGGKGADILIGGKGNDLLTGGNGADVFYFGGADGNDMITDYTAGEDIISVKGSVSYSTVGSNAVLQIGTGKVTLQNAASSAIRIVDENGVASIASGGKISLAPTIPATETVTAITIPGVPHDAAEYNGHYYYFYDLGTTWEGAKTFCESLGGYLLTITDEGEQAAVESLLTAHANEKNHYWLGGYRDETDTTTWLWVTGETWNYTNWAYGEPNSSDGTENAVSIYRNADPLNHSAVGKWNDMRSDIENNTDPFYMIDKIGFICEWGSVDGSISGLIFNNTNTAKASAVTVTSEYSREALYATNYASLDSINAAGRGAVKISGNSRDNVITGSTGNDTLSGGNGNDTIYTGAGGNLVYGDDGNDLLVANAMPAYGILWTTATLDGGSGDDTINIVGTVDGIHPSTVRVDGGAGSDIISIAGGTNGSGIHGGTNGLTVDERTVATIDGGDGDDQIFIVTSSSRYYGIDISNVKINGGYGTDLISIYGGGAGIGGHSIYGGATVSIDGGAGEDTIAVNSIDNLSGVTIVAGEGDLISVGSGGAVYYFDSASTSTINGAIFTANSVGTSASVQSNGSSLSIKSAWDGTVTLSGENSITDISGSVVSGAGSYQLVDGKFTGASSDFTSVTLTTGNDTCSNTAENRIIYALAGDDTIYNYDISNVTINCGTGNDSVFAQGDNIQGYGGAGNDNLLVEVTADLDWKNYSNCTVHSGATLEGGAGDDTLYNNNTNAVIIGGEGNDEFANSANSVNASGGDGNDLMINGQYFTRGGTNLTISGGAGEDTITNSGSNSVLDGGAGNDLIHNGYYYYKPRNRYYEYTEGDWQKDSLGTARVTISGGTGDDTIYSRGNGYNIFQYSTGDGADIIYGFQNNDTLKISGSYTTQKSGSDVIVSVGSGSITLKDYSGAVNIQSVSNGNSPVDDLFTDDNFVGADLDELVDTPIANSAGALSVGGGDSLGAFACDFALAHTDDT